jgi:hypothetical protein
MAKISVTMKSSEANWGTYEQSEDNIPERLRKWCNMLQVNYEQAPEFSLKLVNDVLCLVIEWDSDVLPNLDAQNVKSRMRGH